MTKAPTLEARMDKTIRNIKLDKEILVELGEKYLDELNALNEKYLFQFKDVKTQLAKLDEDVRIYNLIKQVRDGKLKMVDAVTGKPFTIGFNY